MKANIFILKILNVANEILWALTTVGKPKKQEAQGALTFCLTVGQTESVPRRKCIPLYE